MTTKVLVCARCGGNVLRDAEGVRWCLMCGHSPQDEVKQRQGRGVSS